MILLPAFATLLKIEGPRAPGPAPTYSSSHVLVALLTIGNTSAIGRHALAIEAGLGEGAIRTVIKRLKEDGYITIQPQGCQLTAKGKEAYRELKRRIPKTVELSKTSLSVGKEQVVVQVKNRSDQVKSGIEQRDASIRAGAAGATTYIIVHSKFQMPGSSVDGEKDFPSSAWPKLRKELQLENGDVVIVCGSEDRRISFIGAITAALTLLN